MRTVDLFAGCGGMSLGFMRQGFKLVSALELWNVAINCYRENFSHPIIKQDLSDTKRSALKIKGFRPDMIIGGPPCQDFSNAGARKEGKKAELTMAYAQIIYMVRPKYFVMENVDRARLSDTYKSARQIFKIAGYGLTEAVLDACLCGVPQKRKRFICFGALGEEDGFAEKELLNYPRKEPMTVEEYYNENGYDLNFTYYYRHPRNYHQRAIFKVDVPAATVRGTSCPMPKTYKKHPNDAYDVSPEVHSLTFHDRARFQTFPDDFKWNGKHADIETMIGNAMPVRLAEYVAGIVRMTITADSLSSRA